MCMEKAVNYKFLRVVFSTDLLLQIRDNGVHYRLVLCVSIGKFSCTMT